MGVHGPGACPVLKGISGFFLSPAENRQRLWADEQRREYLEEQRNEYENYAEEQRDGESPLEWL